MDNNILQKSEIKKDIDFIKQELGALSGGQKEILKILTDHSKTLADHSEQLAFIYENGATKDELNRVIDKLFDNGTKLEWFKENMVTKEEWRKFIDSYNKRITTMLERLGKE
ncbi:MAG: hypothetical protein V1688_01810 [bacterium]